MRLRSLALLMLSLLLVGSAATSTAAAQATPASAQHFLEGRHHEVQTLLRRPASERRNQALSHVIQDLLDYQALAQGALGDQWQERSEAERTVFADLLKQLVEKNYQRNLESTLDFNVRYVSAEADGDAVVVRTEASSRTNRRAPTVSIDYRLRQSDGTWHVIDISTDGSSMVESYQRQFRRILRRDGWDGLMNRMRSRLTGDSAET